MIERLLAAEKALDQGMLDTAGRLYAQVAQADPRNAIALVGLAKIALREDRIEDARELAEQALAIDPDEAAAQRLLREVYAEVRPQPGPMPRAEPAPHAPAAPEMPLVRNASLLARLRRWLFGPRNGS